MGRCSINLIASICKRHGPGAGEQLVGRALAPQGWGLRVCHLAEHRASPVQALRHAQLNQKLPCRVQVAGKMAWESQWECAGPGAGVLQPRAVSSPCVSAHCPSAKGQQWCGHAAPAPWGLPRPVSCQGGGQAKLCSRGEQGTEPSKGKRASGGFAAVQLELTLMCTWQPFL